MLLNQKKRKRTAVLQNAAQVIYVPTGQGMILNGKHTRIIQYGTWTTLRGLRSRGGKVKTKAPEHKLTTESREKGVVGLTLSHVDLSPQLIEGLRDPSPLLQQGPDSHLDPTSLHVAIGSILAHLLTRIGLVILMVTQDLCSPNSLIA